MTAEEIAKSLFGCKFRFSSEKELQAGIAQAFIKMGVEFTPEVILTARDRIDFMCGDVGVEIKTNDSAGGASLSAVVRQLFRYSQRPEIQSLILVTTRSKHRDLPPTVNGKPLFLVYLLNSVL